MRAILFAATLAAAFLAQGETAYVKVVDEDGKPVPGATVNFAWYANKFSRNERYERRGAVTDASGMARVRPGMGGYALYLEGIDRGGEVCFERWLNPAWKGFVRTSECPESSPFVFTVRRILPKSYLVIPDSISTERIIDLKSGGECVTGRVDLLKLTAERGVLANPLNGAARHGPVAIRPYDDLFVSARYEEASDGWRVAFWTTNANCGVVATAGRRYEAPEAGYLLRAEVSQEEYLSPSFTLYLRTREPRVYAMVVPEGWTGQTPRETRGGPPGQRRFRFQLREVRVNPYGTREMELDGRGQHFFLRGAVKKCVFDNLLKAKRYPPRLDFAALHELACEEDRLFGVIAAQESAANRAEQSARTKALGELPQGPVGAEAMEGVRRAGREARRKAFPKLCEAEDERGRVRQRIDDIIRKANEELDRQK